MNKIISIAVGAAATTFLVLGFSPPAFAPADMFLKIDGIEGESTDSAHKGEIEILYWSWGETTYPRAVGERVMEPEKGAGVLSVTKTVDKASPKLMQYCSTGRHIPKVEIYVTATYYALYDVSLKCGSASGGSDDRPTEEVAFYYSKIKFDYKKQKKDKRDKYKKDREG